MTTTSERSWLSLCLEADPDLYEDPPGYEFSSGRKFISTDRMAGGVYDPTEAEDDPEVTMGGEGVTMGGEAVTW